MPIPQYIYNVIDWRMSLKILVNEDLDVDLKMKSGRERNWLNGLSAFFIFSLLRNKIGGRGLP